MRRLMLIVGILMQALLIGACTSIPSLNIPVSAFGVINQSELITLEAGDKTFAFTARLESDGETLRVVAITPTGQRLFSITKQGEKLSTEAGPLWPSVMPLAAVWLDFEMVHLEMLAQPDKLVLGQGWQRDDMGKGLVIWSLHQQQQATVQRGADQTVLKRPQYQLSIEVLPE
jgi:hypothetical protein